MSKNTLFSSIKLGNAVLKHRVAMAPMTRNRATADAVNTDIAVTYYQQRSAVPGTLIISEATQVSQQGQAYVCTPGIYSPEQISSWKRVVDAVHDNKSYMVAQLWHTGRVSHPTFQKDGELPVGPSAIAARGNTWTKSGEPTTFVTPRELTLKEIQDIVQDFENGAKNAKEAGFDAIELHGANGYLIDQFLQDGTNKRKDQYGGSFANRTRFLLELIEATKGVYSIDQIGVRLSPWGTFGDMSETDTVGLFSHVITELNKQKIGYLHLVEPGTGDGKDGKFAPQQSSKTFRPLFKGTLIAANGYTEETAKNAIESETADIIAFGRPFLANPDLPRRLEQSAPLNAPNYEYLYTGGEKGYIDYPTL